MSSTILYKFRASSTFEALPLPGSAARLFDVKKAIVKANKLDAGSMEFDLAVRNADTSEEYADESMLLPRGTRIIVQRLPAARGQGFLARMARNEHGGGIGNSYQQQQQHPSGYYTIRTRENEEEEFVESSNGVRTAESNDDKELAALQAVTSMQPDGPTMVGGRSAMMGGHRGGRGGPPQPAGMGGPPGGSKPNFNNVTNNKPGGNAQSRPNADPELREQEKKLMPKKRATGIPRTFLSLSAPPQTDGGKEGEGEQQTPLLQPNKQGFKELVSRGGGQSESTAGTRRDLDYVLKLTSTTVPEHLQCAICNNVVKDAMLLPWDSEGRAVKETCIRDALTQNGFRCPLTGIDGVSPDDLIPNVGLRKAVELFIKDVMEKVDEIEQQQVEESGNIAEDATEQSREKNVLNGEGAEKGVLISKRMSLSTRKKVDDDPFGAGDDDFGGDVFAMETKNEMTAESETETDKNEQENNDKSAIGAAVNESKSDKQEDSNSNEKLFKDSDSDGNGNLTSPKIGPPNSKDPNNIRNDETKELTASRADSSSLQTSNKDDHYLTASNEETVQKSPRPKPPAPTSHMRFHRRRGPPVGYTMGPAGGAVVSARANHQSNNKNHSNISSKEQNNYQRGGRGGGRFASRGGGRHGQYNHDRNGGGGYVRGRGGRGRGRGNSRFETDQQDHQSIDDDDNGRGTKRGRDDHQYDEGSGDGQKYRDRNGRGNFRHDGGERGSYGRGGGYRGGRGGRSWGGQQRGNHRGGRGNRSRY